MKKFSIILGFSLISILAFPQWKWQNPSPAGNPLYTVFFTDPAHGNAAGEAGTILKYGLYCRDETRRGVILKTTDAGNSWNTIVSDTVSGLYSIYFRSNNIGYSAGLEGGMMKTTDGGDTWAHQDIAPLADIMPVYFTDDNTGYAAGFDDSDFTGILLKTINGGINWDTLLYFPNFTSLYSVFLPNSTAGYAVGAMSTILKKRIAVSTSVHEKQPGITLYNL